MLLPAQLKKEYIYETHVVYEIDVILYLSGHIRTGTEYRAIENENEAPRISPRNNSLIFSWMHAHNIRVSVGREGFQVSWGCVPPRV